MEHILKVILNERKPKLLLSASFQQNNQAKRAQGQLGNI
jgi:hypothetical protein